jgi:hypothetical protein
VRLGDLEVAEGHLISRSDNTVAVWNLTTGASFPVPLGVKDAAIFSGELWVITGHHAPVLERLRLDGGKARDERPLSTAGLPFYQIRDGIQISADKSRVTAFYAVTEELTALATWDIESGALLWVGPPSASVIGDWVLGGGRAYIPAFGIDQLLRDTGARTNLRLCEKDLRAVPVSPPPAPDTYWAPPEACGQKR